jgi:hypothetical protein
MGPGGMGKTTVARAFLHHPDIVAYFGPNIFFVSCEGISSCVTLIYAIVEAFGFSLAADSGDIFHNFTSIFKSYTSPAILCLDNFETTWESEDSQKMSSLLEHLASFSTTSMLITMRGMEVPATDQIHWENISVLNVLSHEAAEKAFIAVARDDNLKNDPDLGTLLKVLDYVPLAITLLAKRYSTSKESFSSLIHLWKEQKIRFRSLNKNENMDVSIQLSLNSKAMLAQPNALRLLKVLSHLPNGAADDDLPSMVALSEAELVDGVYTLQAASLVFFDNSKHIQTLSPI